MKVQVDLMNKLTGEVMITDLGAYENMLELHNEIKKAFGFKTEIEVIEEVELRRVMTETKYKHLFMDKPLVQVFSDYMKIKKEVGNERAFELIVEDDPTENDIDELINREWNSTWYPDYDMEDVALEYAENTFGNLCGLADYIDFYSMAEDMKSYGWYIVVDDGVLVIEEADLL